MLPPPAPRRLRGRPVPRPVGARQAPRLRAGARRRHPAAAPGPGQRRVPVDRAPRREVPRGGRHTGEHFRRHRAQRGGRAPAAQAVAPAGPVYPVGPVTRQTEDGDVDATGCIE